MSRCRDRSKQSGGASQTAAADGAGQTASLLAAGLLLLTGAFLAPLFEHLPQATFAAIVIVAVSGLFDVHELRRYARVRRSGRVLGVQPPAYQILRRSGVADQVEVEPTAEAAAR